MKTQSNSDALSVPLHRLVRHWLRMGYGRICHAVWLRLPESIAMQSRFGAHLLGWAGYWANMTWSMPNDQARRSRAIKADHGTTAIARSTAVSSSARRYRVVRALNIWTDGERFSPESRPKWWPFWFRFDDGTGCQISFRRADAAKRFIEVARWEDRDELTKLREWILAAAPVMESAICIDIEERPDRIGEIPGCQAIMETCPLEWEPMPHLRQNDSDELTRRGEK